VKGNALVQVQRQHLRGILEAVADCAQYPETSSAPAVDVDDSAGDPDALEAREAENAAADRRQELFVLFRNAAKARFALSFCMRPCLVFAQLAASLGLLPLHYTCPSISLAFCMQWILVCRGHAGHSH
jgi:hypothetical protein